MTQLTCPHCEREIELSQAFTKDIEKTVTEELQVKQDAEMLKYKKSLQEASNRLLAEKSAEAQAAAAAKLEHTIQALTKDAEAAKADNRELREQLGKLMTDLRESQKARDNAELEMQKKLAAQEDKIRAEISLNADEKYRLKIAESEKKLADTQRALEDAQRKAAQGSQQNQGEVLELDLENRLREEFPYDEIIEVKKGQRGADIKQVVRSQNGTTCGLLLWETKNGKWQPAWVAKFKADIREAGASIGVIVSQETPSDIGEMKHLEGNLWVVSPKHSTRLAAALRATILQVDAANKMNAGKDAKMESLYQFLVGPEFRHRVEAIVENYTILQDEIEREKRASALKWARQEKSIRAVIDNTIGMYGDLQGITSRALPAIKSLEFESGEDPAPVLEVEADNPQQSLY